MEAPREDLRCDRVGGAASGGDAAKKPSREPEPAARVLSKETPVENAAATNDDPTDDTSTHVVSARLVGSKRHKEGRARLKHGASLRLRRDRANAHDPNAIAVDVTVGILPIHAGFVKGTQAETLAPALDSGALAVVACVVDAPNGVDALPTSEVPVRLTLRRRDGDDASSGGDASSASAARDVPLRRPSLGRARAAGNPRGRGRGSGAGQHVAHAPR